MKAKPVPGEPCLTVEARGLPRTLVLADIHFGFEAGLARSGAFVPSSTKALEERLLSLVAKTRAKRLAFLGDVKHAIGHTTRQERFELPPLFRRLADEVAVVLALGNHDAGLRDALPRHDNLLIAGAGGIALRPEGEEGGGVGLLHGHAWPAVQLMTCELLLCGHSHPAVALVDRWQGVSVEPAWLHCDVNEDAARQRYGQFEATKAVVVPAFNPLLGGTPVNTEGLLGPMRRLLRWQEGRVFLGDGVFLGAVKDLAVPDSVMAALRARRRQVYLEVEGHVPAEVEAEVGRFLRAEAARKARARTSRETRKKKASHRPS